METLWVILGIAVLGLTLVDVFLTALNYDEAGFFAGRLAALQWTVLRAGALALDHRTRTARAVVSRSPRSPPP